MGQDRMRMRCLGFSTMTTSVNGFGNIRVTFEVANSSSVNLNVPEARKHPVHPRIPSRIYILTSQLLEAQPQL